ncbi:MAG: damage-inducible protein [Zetaproteobacteria bacterium CG06_land_8_20_14_3_00_59_53]|nr:MAG: damage-inducible protein [Zetaproteobacteria bacterium CG2_30_59_37]PIO90777.1 MAG: damage-inducible protein [Zetaproteobacteria bacterium CG23_combo_of_CG06-09_8_20_14_all_59_86]PIQ64903.1 MAG: damage-inducible protein [Zetaproteobacteria bacterium CG11_big_fil_rev_8_21_14_0_20_59_439]PIU70552.1 MAG: damage-inducible protein [Zetaproteobacteria bacterium CG06_land_8_20_14_3_00_59_53]PIU95930.1 MAG: damage-inducible protein [Zetaproteobacteria bacterium CG03_land_8_20_14_0_80_59_51]PIY
MSAAQRKHQTAAILVIGNEILSGRTREANAYLAAQQLFERGCRLSEVAVVPDIADSIIGTVNRLRASHDAVISSGGIGPTHDDITMECMARAFDVPLIEHRYIVQAMTEYYGEEGLNDGRRRMSRVPQGAHLIRCEKTIAPGARIGNVYVLAGVPSIFASQLEVILDDFGGLAFHRMEVEVCFPESTFAAALDRIQQQFPDVEIGSYPGTFGIKPCGKICLSSQDAEQLESAHRAVQSLIEKLQSA